MPIDDATWAQVHAAYIANELTVDEICVQYGIKFQQLYARRSAGKWPLRGRPNARKKPLDENSPPPTARAARAQLILRLYNAIDLKLIQMEKLMTNPDPAKPTTSADHERETRALTGLIRNFERVTELNSDLTSPARSARTAAASTTDAAASAPASTSAAGSAPNAASTEQLRRDIAQRLERLMGKGNPPGNAG